MLLLLTLLMTLLLLLTYDEAEVERFALKSGPRPSSRCVTGMDIVVDAVECAETEDEEEGRVVVCQFAEATVLELDTDPEGTRAAERSDDPALLRASCE